MFDSDFYHGTIRKYVIIFGSLFVECNLVRNDKDGKKIGIFRVPLTYAPKDKMLARIFQDPNIDRPSAIPFSPRMSFEIVNVYPDPSRKLTPLTKNVKIGDDANTFKVQYAPVPFNFDFNLYVYVKNAEDGTKIVEQILPYFNPDWTVSAELIPELQEFRDIPVILKSIQQNDNYESDMVTRRAIIWTLSFTLKGYIYGRIKSKPVIKFIDVGAYITDTTNKVTEYSLKPGLTANGEPTSDSSNSVAVSEIWVTDDFGYIEGIKDEDEIEQ